MWKLYDELTSRPIQNPLGQWDAFYQKAQRVRNVISYWSVSGRSKQHTAAVQVARSMRAKNITWEQVYAAFLLGGLDAVVEMLPWSAHPTAWSATGAGSGAGSARVPAVRG